MGRGGTGSGPRPGRSGGRGPNPRSISAGPTFSIPPGPSTGQEGDITDALDRLAADADVQLFVVYVDSFDGVSPGQSWADATAERNGLGTNDVLMAVAVTDRNYQLSYPKDFQLSDTETRQIESELIEPRLMQDDWAGAAIAAADGLREKITAPGFPWGWVLLGLIVIVALVSFIRARVRKRRVAHRAEPESTGPARRHPARATRRRDQDQRAGAWLFAVAQFGDEAAKPFVTALAEAKEKARAAFELRQKLDDAFPESADERRAMTLKIVELAEAADAELERPGRRVR